jgi:hypothetical protein
LYRAEFAAQSSISGYDIGIATKKGEHYGWRVESRIEGQSVDALVEVLVWSDIVRNSMVSTIPTTYLQLVRTAFVYIGSGALRRLMWLRKGPVIVALYPVGMLLLQMLIAVLLGLLAGKLLGWMLTSGARAILGMFSSGDASDLNFSTLNAGRMVAQWAVGAWTAFMILWWFEKKDGKFF